VFWFGSDTITLATSSTKFMDTNCTPKPLEFSKLEKATVSSARVVFISGKLTPTYEWGMSSKQDNQAS